MENYKEYTFADEKLIFDNLSSNICVWGKCGSGKSILLGKMVQSLIDEKEKGDIYIFDTKIVEFSEKHFSLNGEKAPIIIKKPYAMKEAVESLLKKAESGDETKSYLFVDEMADLREIADLIARNSAIINKSNIRLRLFSQRDYPFKNLRKSGLEFRFFSLDYRNETRTVKEIKPRTAGCYRKKQAKRIWHH